MTSINIFELARKHDVLEGEITLEAMPEVAGLIEHIEGETLRYVAEGLGMIRDLPAVHLSVEGEVVMSCARCQEGVIMPLESSHVFRLTQTEQEADAIPMSEDDDDEEVIVGSTHFSIEEWVQEEVLLELPSIAVHEECDMAPLEGSSVGDEEAPAEKSSGASSNKKKISGDTQRPFANLQDLLKH